MRILHQFRLMTSNRFGIPLILVKRIKIAIVQTWEKDFNEPPLGFERTNELISNAEKSNLVWTTVRIENE